MVEAEKGATRMDLLGLPYSDFSSQAMKTFLPTRYSETTQKTRGYFPHGG